MPTYDWECPHCGRSAETFCSIKDHGKEKPDCCGQPMSQVIGAAYVTPDIAPYRSVATGEYIGGRAQHRAHLKQHGLIEVGNERLGPRKHVDMPSVGPDLRRTIQELTSGSRNR